VSRKLALLCSAFVLAASIAAASASADPISSLIGGNCGTTSQPFAPWNDSASYYLAGNGGFESAGGWTFTGGAAVVASLKVAKRLGPGKRVVTIIPDSAERYLSKKIFEGGL